jgi:hypothetical protein
MELGEKILDFLLRVCAVGRSANKGKLYRLKSPIFFSSNIFLRIKPGAEGDRDRCYRIPASTLAQGSFLILSKEEEKPLWEQWVKVLFSDDDGEFMIGWLPYHEFNRLVHSEWSWEEEKSQ